MFRRKRKVQNEAIARQMRQFFKNHASADPVETAKNYGMFLWDHSNDRIANESELARSRFHVGLATSGDRASFDLLTKRSVLIADTLLLTHDATAKYHDIGETGRTDSRDLYYKEDPGHTFHSSDTTAREWLEQRGKHLHGDELAKVIGMHCPSLGDLGSWLIDAEELLSSGLAWYLPRYATDALPIDEDGKPYRYEYKLPPSKVRAVDFLVRDGRAVDVSGAEPIRSQLVRPVLQLELPFIEGVSLREFGKITTGEFDSYAGFRDFLRHSFLAMDDSLNATQSDRELTKLALQIKDQVRAARADIEKAHRKRAMATTGAVIGATGAILLAVHGPALAAAVAAVGATGGGIWGIVNAVSENSVRAVRQNKWYYVWVLAGKRRAHII